MRKTPHIWYIVVILAAGLVLGAGVTYMLWKYPVERSIVSSVDQVKSQGQKLPTAQPVAAEDPTASWKTFKSSQYQYKFLYPPEWIVSNSSDDAYVILKSADSSVEKNYLTVDLGCVFATGFEGETPEIVERTLEYGQHTFHEERYFLTENGKKITALDLFRLNFPQSYKDSQQATNKQFHAQCDFAQIIANPDLDTKTLGLILSHFTFLQ